MADRSVEKQLAVALGGLYLRPGAVLSEAACAALQRPNPAFATWQRLRQQGKCPPRPPEHVDGWRTLPDGHEWSGGLALPRHARAAVDLPLRLVDRTTCPPAAPLGLSVTLRDYQEQALDAWAGTDGGQGVVVAPCGAGKTTLGLAAIARMSTPALVLVHTLDLARQWVDRAKTQLDVDAVLVAGGEAPAPGRLTVATFQTLSTWSWWVRLDWGKHFGLVLVDEAHHTPAETFAEVLLSLPARHRLGLTATPERPDGLTELLWWNLGPMVARIEQDDLVEAGQVMAPRVTMLPTRWSAPGGLEWSALLSEMAAAEDRNLGIRRLVRDLVDRGRQVLVLTERVEHAGELAEDLEGAGYAAAAISGQSSKRARRDTLAAAASGAVRALFATTVADEGLDLPRLDALVLTMPCTAPGRLTQRVGRVMRAADGKPVPLVYDLLDEGGALYGLAKKRVKVYRELGAEVAWG